MEIIVSNNTRHIPGPDITVSCIFSTTQIAQGVISS